MKLSDQELLIISNNQPQDQPKDSLMQAAVAIILRDGENGTEFLLMQRAKHENDPWSGQMSFPGGKIEKSDVSAKAAAIRETDEEVGIQLDETDYIGQLDDLYGLKVNNKYSVHVACFVFKPKRRLSPVGNHEVADIVWMPISYLENSKHAHPFYHPNDERVKMPAILLDAQKEQILWGLSLRMLVMLFELLNRPMRALSDDELQIMQNMEGRNIKSKQLDKFTKKILDKRPD